jgi:putative hydrolase of the HAD superfamily
MQTRATDTRCLLIDAMGTLLALDPPAPRLRAELARRFGVEISLDHAQGAIRAEIRYYRAHMHEGRDAAGVRRLRDRCAEVLGAALAQSVGELGGDRLTETLLASLHFSVFEDAAGALGDARSQDWRVVVVSNWDASLSEVLERLGLGPLLDDVVTSAGAGASKPDPAIFRHALDLVGCEPGAALHVGDSLDEDVRGARAAGIEPVWLNRDGRPGVDGVRTISTLAELRL